MRRTALAAAALLALAAAARADASPVSPGVAAPSAFPVPIVAEFDLVGHHGERVRAEDLRGRAVALFFGYANCAAICSVALPRMAGALNLLGEDGAHIQPVMITVDPERDDVAALAAAMPRHHPRLLGLTGSADALAAARAAFQVEVTEIARDAAGDPILAHGSFVYLIGRDGRVTSVLPPILSEERLAEIMRLHLAAP